MNPNILLTLVVWQQRVKDESTAKEAFLVFLPFSIALVSARVTEGCPRGNKNPDQMKVSLVMVHGNMVKVLRVSGRRVVTQPTLPKSVLCVGEIKESRGDISKRDSDGKLWLQL